MKIHSVIAALPGIIMKRDTLYNTLVRTASLVDDMVLWGLMCLLLKLVSNLISFAQSERRIF